MDKRVPDIYAAFIRKELYSKAYELLETSYKEDKAGTYPLIEKFRAGLTALMKKGSNIAAGILRKTYFLTAKDYFDDFCIAMEWDREPYARFYLPRRKQLLPVVKQLQRLHDDKLDVLGISLPPGVGKTGICQFYLMWCAGNDPEHGILVSSHNSGFLRGMYEEALREFDPDGDYCWDEIFPGHKVVKTNAIDLKIDVDRAQRFSTLQYRPVGGQNAGLARAIQLLYCDDLVEGIEEALSANRLEIKWTKFSTDLLQRSQGGCKILMVGTRWSLGDPIGRLQKEYSENPRAYFLVMPALNDKGESNFDYGGKNGYSTAYYKNIKQLMDPASFAALYQGEPVERSGILYPADELRRFYDLPTVEPDAIWAACDTKNKGEDYCVMPVAYQYGGDYYIVDFVIDNKGPEVLEPMLANALVKHKVKIARFESNSAGGRIAQGVQERVKEQGGITKILTKYTMANKETRILVDSMYVKEHFLFLSPDKYNSQYRLAMNFLCSYTTSGKNRHDDVPDSVSMMANLVQGTQSTAVQIVQFPF